MASGSASLPNYRDSHSLDDGALTGSSQWHGCTNGAGSYNRRCLDILHLLQNCHLINSFGGQDELEQLVLKLDNIKLRFAIWLRLNHKTTQNDYNTIIDILIRLDLCLSDEVKSVYQGCGHGMIYHEETISDIDRLDSEEDQTPLYRKFKHHAEKYLIERQLGGYLGDIRHTWIVTDSSICLDFLRMIDGLVEELIANTTREISFALARGHASSAVRELSLEELQSVERSGFSDSNIIIQAAQSRLRASHTLEESSTVTFADTAKGKGLFIDPLADTESLADSLEPIFTPTTSEASPSAEEYFERIADRSKESRDLALIQDRPLNQLAQRRILAELRQADTVPSFVSIACIDNSISNLLGIISGPPDTPYEKGVFFIKIEIPKEYPLQAARFKFLTKIYHPNINSAGQVCVTIHDRHWAIGCSIEGLLTTIYSLLASPNSDDPLVSSVGTEFKNNRKLFDVTAKSWTAQYATRYWPTEDELLTPIGFSQKMAKTTSTESDQSPWGSLFKP